MWCIQWTVDTFNKYCAMQIAQVMSESVRSCPVWRDPKQSGTASTPVNSCDVTAGSTKGKGEREYLNYIVLKLKFK